MSELRVARRYAKSLLDLGIEKGLVDALMQDISLFKKTVDSNHQLSVFLKSPIINGDKKLKVIQGVFSKNFNPLTISFMQIIIRKRREILLQDIAAEFIHQYNLLKEIYEATVITASPIDEKTRKEVLSFIEKETGKKYELKSKTDPSIIGGLVIRMDDKLIDASVASKLSDIRKKLINSYITK